jgi:signal transduction histidine kinase
MLTADWSFRAKITAALILVAAFVSLSTGFFAIRESYQALIRQQRMEALQVAKILAVRTDAMIAITRTSLERLSTEPEIIALDGKRAQPLITLVESTSELIDGIVIADARGRVVAMDTRPPATPGLLPKNSRELLMTPVNGGSTAISNAFMSKSGIPCFALETPVRRAGRIVGSVSYLVMLTRSSLAKLAEVQLGETGYVLLAESSGRVILHPNPSRLFQSALSLAPQNALQGLNGTSEYLAADGTKRVAAFAQVPKAGWIVVVSRSVSEAYAAGTRLLFVLGGIFLAGLAFSVLVGVLMARGLARPVAELTRGVREMTAGDLETRLAADGHGEIGRLTQGFNAMADRLSRMIHELDAFNYSVAHDLRAPARTVAGFSELILRRKPDLDEASRRDLQRITEAGVRMRQMLDGLLDLSRLTQTRLTLETVDISAESRRALAGLAAAEPERSVTATVADGLRTRGDLRLVQALLQDLLENAWKFTRDRSGARIEVGLRKDAEGAVFFVRDNGPGFDPALAGRLFMPFHRLPGSEAYPGLGLGLASAARIVEAHGGRLWVEARPGAGAAFYFTLGAET